MKQSRAEKLLGTGASREESGAEAKKIAGDVLTRKEISFSYKLSDNTKGMPDKAGTVKIKSSDVVNKLAGATKTWDNGFMVRISQGDKSAVREYQKWLETTGFRFSFDNTSPAGDRVSTFVLGSAKLRNLDWGTVEIKYAGTVIFSRSSGK